MGINKKENPHIAIINAIKKQKKKNGTNPQDIKKTRNHLE
jgi:hypothetical protein